MVSTLETNKSNSMLVSADSHGFIYVWNIANYCVDHPETESPECKYYFQSVSGAGR